MSKKTGLGGGKKDLNAELNLTPFIDLLSTCVCFLLITAVWLEIGTVEIKQSHGTAAEASKKETFDLDLVFKKTSSLRLNLKRNGKRVKSLEVKDEDFKSFLGKLDQTINEKILIGKKGPVKIATATVTPRSDVDYGQLISTLDVLRKNQIMNIGMLTARGR